MTPKERVSVALRGGMPDCIPIVPIYDAGYICRATGADTRMWHLHSADDRIRMIEDSFLLHREIDGFFVHTGTSDEPSQYYDVERLDAYWLVTDTRTGERFGLLPDGSLCTAEGQSLSKQGGALGFESLINSEDELDSLVDSLPTPESIDKIGYRPLRHLAAKYPDYHFSFQSGTPMVAALSACGGFAEGLTLMATKPDVFTKLLERLTEHKCALLRPGREAGADSVWFTCYYTGADTISPRDYADMIFPFEREICLEAKKQGLYVLNWYLGDLMPNLDQVMKLPIDALVLEQGRKGYEIDPVAIRERVGPRFCLFGFGYEHDYCTCNRAGLTAELERQISGAGADGAFVVGTPIMPPDADPAAVDHYFSEARRLTSRKDVP